MIWNLLEFFTPPIKFKHLVKKISQGLSCLVLACQFLDVPFLLSCLVLSWNSRQSQDKTKNLLVLWLSLVSNYFIYSLRTKFSSIWYIESSVHELSELVRCDLLLFPVLSTFVHVRNRSNIRRSDHVLRFTYPKLFYFLKFSVNCQLIVSN